MKTSLLLILAAVGGLLAACNRHAMPAASVHTVQTHMQNREHTRRDSIFVRDSVRIFMQSDTVFVTHERWHYADRLIRDTLWRCDTLVRRDSIPYPVEVVRFETHVPALYRWSLWIALAFVGWILWRIFRR